MSTINYSEKIIKESYNYIFGTLKGYIVIYGSAYKKIGVTNKWIKMNIISKDICIIL
jgi:hypothetical protein